MSKKCEKCGAPITGFWSKISKVFGVEQSKNNPNLCNKCDVQQVSSVEPQVEEKEPQTASAKPMVAPADEVMTEPADEVMKVPKTEPKPATDDLIKETENKVESKTQL